MSIFENTPFSKLVKENSDLAALRREYASVSAEKRRMAADWEYHSEIANELFNESLERLGTEGLGTSSWPSGVAAFAIDPLYAPAILTVASIEYQLGRVEEAMELFNKLAALPKDEEDITTIIEKAGDFLIEQDDYENSLLLYSAAEKAYPHEAVYPIGAGYCLGKLGRYDESIEKYRRAVALEPDNYKHLNDLGFTLLEAGKFDEAEAVLERSILLAPEDYEIPRNNLSELKEKRGRERATS